MKLAVRSQDLNAGDAAGLAVRLGECRIDGLQLACHKTFGRIKNEPGQLSGEFLSEFRALKGAGKEVFLMGAYFNPVHGDAEKVKKGVEIFKEHIRLCGYAGCRAVGSETGSYNGDSWTYNPLNRTEGALNRVAGIFRELCDYAEPYGVRVGIEGAAGHVAYSPETLDRLLEKIGRENARVIFDLFNYLDGGNHARYLDILKRGLDLFKGRIFCFHMKDCVVENGAAKQVAVGRGGFDYRRILTLIREYDENAVMVLEGTAGGDIIPAVDLIRTTWENL
ncbi:MAG: sugar phosphate isomerase/epimerase [Clostridiales bacterium]|nr:sugar phosphate isomerase/epimerase [Clostridiales bacterium]